MKISELPKPLKELALKRRKEYGLKSKEDVLHKAFLWFATPEGGVFWSEVEDGDFKGKIEAKNETKHEKLMRRLNKAVELHAQAQNYELSERKVKLCTYLYEKRNKYLRELIYTQIEHSNELPFN